MEDLVWNCDQRLWHGVATLDADTQVEVVVIVGDLAPDIALAYARFAFSQLASKLESARRFAAHKLLEYYNYYNKHLKDGEHLTDEEFAMRLRLEGVRFTGEGRTHLDFGHDFYRGHYLEEGGLVVVDATAEGRFTKAYWVSKSDAEEARRLRRQL